MGSGLPVKILVSIDDLYQRKQSEDDTAMQMDWPARLANMVMALEQVYVLQSPVSSLDFLYSGMLDGLAYAGPALFSVYVGGMKSGTTLPTYLDAASASESRAFPMFFFNPGKGQTQAERIDVTANTQSDRDWPLESFSYRTANEEEVSIDLAFTLADFLLCDQDCASQFRCIAVQQWHENMLPLHDYLRLDPDAAQSRIPYLLTVNNEGELGRVIMTRSIIEMVRRCSSSWYSLQELGGINNSFALNLIAEEKDRLVAEMQEQVDAIERKYTDQLDQDIGKLTGEIVKRIAAQLLQDGASGAAIPMSAPGVESTPMPTVRPVDAVAEEALLAEEEDEDEDEDEIGALDDPYIETPRCTSCDDCTNLNGQLFAYDENKQAIIKDATAGSYKDMVRAAELCPVKIIHPGKPKNPAEPGLEALLQRAAPFM
jgi:ferredoxin